MFKYLNLVILPFLEVQSHVIMVNKASCLMRILDCRLEITDRIFYDYDLCFFLCVQVD